MCITPQEDKGDSIKVTRETSSLYKMRNYIMFITDVCVLFLIKLRWPRNKSRCDCRIF